MDRVIRVLIVEDDLDERIRLTSEIEDLSGVDVQFTSTGHHALARIEFHGDTDVLVTTASKSRSEGLHLLTEVQLKYPHVGRVLVAKGEDLERDPAVARAHQLLKFPTVAKDLAAFAHRYKALSGRGTRDLELIGGIASLPTPPQHIQMLNEAISSPTTSMETLAQSLESDVGVAAKLLSLVNSAYFGLSHRVSSVRHALMYLGLETTRNLVSAMELMQTISQVPEDLRSYVQLVNSHSMQVATNARHLADGTNYVHDAFAAGLLHDVGILALLQTNPRTFRELCSNPEDEMSILGTTHAEVGAALLDSWGLPWQIVDAVSRSHTADEMSNPIASAADAVFVAEQIASLTDTAPMPWEKARMPLNSYLDALKAREVVLELVNQRVY